VSALHGAVTQAGVASAGSSHRAVAVACTAPAAELTSSSCKSFFLRIISRFRRLTCRRRRILVIVLHQANYTDEWHILIHLNCTHTQDAVLLNIETVFRQFSCLVLDVDVAVLVITARLT